MRIRAHTRLCCLGVVELEDAVDWQRELPRGHGVPQIGAHVADFGPQLIHRPRAVGDPDIGYALVGVEVAVEFDVTAAKTPDPKTAIPAALRSMALRLFLFYILALTILVSFIPWTDVGAKVVAQSPFVKVFAHTGIAYAAGIMNFVVLTAALSSMNTNVYLCSRMLFSLSRADLAPRFLGRLSNNGTPVAAILVSGACILLCASVSKLTPRAYNYLFGVALFDAMIVWLAILLSHFSFRRRYLESELPVRMPLFPLVQIVGLGLLIGVLVTMGLDKEVWGISWIVGIPVLVLLSIVYFVRKGRAAGGSSQPLQEPGP